MSSDNFQGNIPASAVKQVFVARQLGREDIAKKSIVNKAEPIDTSQFSRSNSEILYGKFPEESAIKGLVHDATVALQALEPGFRQLSEPSEQRVLELLEGSIDGSGRTTPELKNRINSLESSYGIGPDQILDYSFEEGGDVRQMLETVAAHRHQNWEEDVDDFAGVDPEKTVFDMRMSGRIDLVYWGYDETDRQVEIKMSDQQRKEDELQASIYWLVTGEDADIMIDYPVIGERKVYSSGEREDFDPESYTGDIIECRDTALNAINHLRDLQSEYFDFYDSREKATREALRELEVF